MGLYNLDHLFNPQSIAVIGASEQEGRVGRDIMENLETGGYPNAVYPVNPNHERLLGQRCFASLTDLPETPDLAVIAVPIRKVPDITAECVAKGRQGRHRHFRRWS